MNKQASADKLTIREKVSFSFVNIGNIPVMILISAFLLIFYTDVVGLSPAAVATLFLVARIFDGINDPIIGYIIDHLPQTRMGRFRPYLIIGAVLCSLNFLLLWFGPILFPGIKLLVSYITYILIGISFDLMDIPLNSLLPVMTDHDPQRNTLSVIKGFSCQMGVMAITFAAPFILASSSSQLRGYVILIGSATAVIIVFSVIGVLGIKERIRPAIHQLRYSRKDVLRILTIKPLMIFYIAALISTIGSVLTGTMNIYYFTYILDHDLRAMSVNSLFVFASSVLGMLMLKKLCSELEKKHIFTIAMIISAAGLLLRFINLTSLPMIYTSNIITSFGQGICLSLSYTILAINVELVEYNLGFRAEATINSIKSFIGKAAGAIGGAIPGYVLTITGYLANEAQNPSTITGIIIISLAVPAILYLISAFIFGYCYKFYKAQEEEVIISLQLNRMNNKE